MKVDSKKGQLAEVKDDVLCVFLFQDEEPPWDVKQFTEGISKERFEAKLLQTFYTSTLGKAKFKQLVLIGLGKKDEFKLDFLRRAAGTAVRYAASIKEKKLAIYVTNKFITKKNLNEHVQAITEGAILAAYKFTKYKTKKDDLFRVEHVHVVCGDEVSEGVKLGTVYANAQNYARQLDEEPANIANPKHIVDEAKKLASEHGIDITVFDKAALKKMGMHSLLGVAQGSVNDPYLVKLEYNKEKKSYPLYAVVGKGVTFDTGGISIKPSNNMHEMKYDKTGSVNVLGVMKAVSDLKLPIRLLGIMAMVENMPSGTAQRPGDIVKTYNGKTVEVLNTDAEGRMILADALSYAAEDKPEYIIDMATLTGAIVVALGKHAIGLFSNDDKLCDALKEAGEHTHERVWRLPAWSEYTEMMKADFADLKNISETGEAGSITGAVFLQEFVGDCKWAHLDIAAVDLVKTPHPYIDKGASGIGVRLVTETLKRLAKK